MEAGGSQTHASRLIHVRESLLERGMDRAKKGDPHKGK